MNEPDSESFGALFERLRLDNRLTLRAFCEKADADPGNISRMERGTTPPPQSHEILRRYAKALSLEEGSDLWHQFFDSAEASRGLIPSDILSDEELVRQLPAFFRTLRGQRPTKTEMWSVIEKIKAS